MTVTRPTLRMLKTGQGFYAWTPESAAALRARIAGALAGFPEGGNAVPPGG